MSLPTNPRPSEAIPKVTLRRDTVARCPVCNPIYGMPWIENVKDLDDWIERQLAHYVRGNDLHDYKRPTDAALKEFKDGDLTATLTLEPNSH